MDTSLTPRATNCNITNDNDESLNGGQDNIGNVFDWIDGQCHGGSNLQPWCATAIWQLLNLKQKHQQYC